MAHGCTSTPLPTSPLMPSYGPVTVVAVAARTTLLALVYSFFFLFSSFAFLLFPAASFWIFQYFLLEHLRISFAFKDKVIFRHWFCFDPSWMEGVSEKENRINEISGQKYRKWISFVAYNQHKRVRLWMESGSKRAKKARFKCSTDTEYVAWYTNQIECAIVERDFNRKNGLFLCVITMAR